MGLSALHTGDPARVGEFTILGRLGAGGMGVVYLGQDPSGRQVAIKQLRDGLASDREFRARFRREAAALLRVQGICTARVLAVEAEASCPFIVMEYVPGPTLAEYVAEHGPMRAEMAHAFAVGLAEALVAIHRAGVVHRDLKPGNVLLSGSGPKVIDFGIAYTAGATALTRAGVAIGTAGYMAPEQLRGQAGPPADVFAWAATVAFAATGRAPFGTGPAEAVVHRVLFGEPDLDGVPARLKTLLTSALARSAAQRPTARQLLATLTGAEAATGLGDEDAATVLASALGAAWHLPHAPARPRHSRRLHMGALAAASAAVLVVGFLAARAVPSATAPDNRIANVASGLCLDTDGPQRIGLDVVLRTCGNYSGQIWLHDQASLHLTNTPTGLCLDTDAQPAPGVTVILEPCGSYSGQSWVYDTATSHFANPASGLCLSTNAPPALGIGLMLRACGDYAGEIWRMRT